MLNISRRRMRGRGMTRRLDIGLVVIYGFLDI
jgi:hypothetical protein